MNLLRLFAKPAHVVFEQRRGGTWTIRIQDGSHSPPAFIATGFGSLRTAYERFIEVRRLLSRPIRTTAMIPLEDCGNAKEVEAKIIPFEIFQEAQQGGVQKAGNFRAGDVVEETREEEEETHGDDAA